MRLVTVIILPHRLDEVRAALRAFGISQCTVTPVLQTAGRGRPEIYRGVASERTLHPRAKMEIVADDLDASDIMRVVAVTIAGTGTIWITHLDQAVSIRTRAPLP